MRWKPVKRFEGLYQVSENGLIRSLYNRVVTNKIRWQATTNQGYKRVYLCKNKKPKYYPVHRLVAEAFVPNPKNKPFINHIDNNPSNNFYKNLEWVTSKENSSHAKKQNRHAHGERQGNAKLKEQQIVKIKKLYKKGMTQTKLASLFNTDQTNISLIINSKSWKHTSRLNI